MEDKLTELVKKGISKKYELKALVLERYADITAARQNLRTWGEIAEALGLQKSRGKDMSPCYLRISKSIASGKLKPGKAVAVAGLRATQSDRASVQEPRKDKDSGGSSNFINLDKP
ncbi:hypothetical protein GL267_007290 [Acidithiobacillus ferrianus]|uniref:Uncharacterized protein n=2 Tax=Acidithiobacillus ferrianus TaxID=2678518 RepID=A0A845U8J8_9PROT|nr:hypothetical protein [Acidithiobacillus ferrianus]NDU42077.1 hypothetical protein [Acidithiobacillus ferrianus]